MKENDERLNRKIEQKKKGLKKAIKRMRTKIRQEKKEIKCCGIKLKDKKN